MILSSTRETYKCQVKQVGYSYAHAVLYVKRPVFEKVRKWFKTSLIPVERWVQVYESTNETMPLSRVEHMHKHEMVKWFHKHIDAYEAYADSWADDAPDIQVRDSETARIASRSSARIASGAALTSTIAAGVACGLF